MGQAKDVFRNFFSLFLLFPFSRNRKEQKERIGKGSRRGLLGCLILPFSSLPCLFDIYFFSVAARAILGGCCNCFEWLQQRFQIAVAATQNSYRSRFAQMQDDALHLSWREAPDSGMIAQLKQFGFQHAMKVDPPPKLQGRCPTAEMGAVKLGKFAYPVGSYREGRLFHEKIGFIFLMY